MPDDDEDPAAKKWISFANRLRVARAELGMPALAKMVERLPWWAPLLDPATLSRYENGKHLPDALLLYAVAIAYGVAVSELLAALEEDARRAAQ